MTSYIGSETQLKSGRLTHQKITTNLGKNEFNIWASYHILFYFICREIVAAAHLKPLSKQDMRRKQPEWRCTDLD